MNRSVATRADRPVPEHHVLVIEDEPQMRAMLTDNLEFEGYRVTGVESGEEALRECNYQAFALLIVDVMRPFPQPILFCNLILRRMGEWFYGPGVIEKSNDYRLDLPH